MQHHEGSRGASASIYSLRYIRTLDAVSSISHERPLVS